MMRRQTRAQRQAERASCRRDSDPTNCGGEQPSIRYSHPSKDSAPVGPLNRSQEAHRPRQFGNALANQSQKERA